MAFAVACAKWLDFRDLVEKSSQVLYEVDGKDGVIRIWAIKAGHIYSYSEELPYPTKVEVKKGEEGWRVSPAESPSSMGRLTLISKEVIRKQLTMGLGYTIAPQLSKHGDRWLVEFRYSIEPDEARNLLSVELKVPKESILQGRITTVS